ncbi:hypothetical protein FACS1894200_14000 [Spirochaetia bacterium]|nr:hypothetical protein FACS1894200_14000 [Spirochaetia bacterium]
MCIQQEIMLGKYNLAWSYVLDYEIGLSPFEERRDKFLKWKKVAKCFCDENETLLSSAEKLFSIGFKTIDALHTAAAIYMKCDYLVTTDRKMLNKNTSHITIVNPIDFLRKEVFYEN